MTSCTTNPAPHVMPLPRRSPLAWLRFALALRRQRRHLATLDAARLRDIGLTPDRALAESQRPVWDVPQNWLR